MTTFQNTISKLTSEQQQLLAVTILNCECGSAEYDFQDEQGEWECVPCVYFNTKGVSEYTNITPRKVSAIFRSIYKAVEGNGAVINHHNNWLEDGTMNALFLRDAVYNEAIKWAKGFSPDGGKPNTEQEFEAQREALKSELEGIMGKAKERVDEFVHDSLKRYGDYRIEGGYTPDHFTIALHNGEKPVWGAHFDVYVHKNWETKKTELRLNIGTAGSFALGEGSERESLYLAFAKFINDVNDWGLGKYLIRVHEKANDVWHRFGKLCDQYKKDSCHVSLFGD